MSNLINTVRVANQLRQAEASHCSTVGNFSRSGQLPSGNVCMNEKQVTNVVECQVSGQSYFEGEALTNFHLFHFISLRALRRGQKSTGVRALH